jgi:hypothetical protein
VHLSVTVCHSIAITEKSTVVQKASIGIIVSQNSRLHLVAKSGQAYVGSVRSWQHISVALLIKFFWLNQPYA